MSGYERLIGTWRLLSLKYEMEDTGEIVEPWGPHPTGWLVLTPEGRLITLGAAADRPIPTTDAEAAAQWRNMVSYSGRTRMDGDARFVTEVDTAWHPSWIGTQQARNFVLDGDRLSVRTDAVSPPANSGRRLCAVLTWQREA